MGALSFYNKRPSGLREGDAGGFEFTGRWWAAASRTCVGAKRSRRSFVWHSHTNEKCLGCAVGIFAARRRPLLLLTYTLKQNFPPTAVKADVSVKNKRHFLPSDKNYINYKRKNHRNLSISALTLNNQRSIIAPW